MAEPLLGVEEVCKQLQLTKDQVMILVKQGQLRGFLDQKTYKFRSSDVQKYKIEEGGTVLLDGEKTDITVPGQEVTEALMEPAEEAKSDTSRIDLADIEGEPGSEESDQTSVLAPVADAEDEAAKEEEPAFEFSEEDLGLSLDDEAAESVLVADESESSVDIIETVDETSSDSATSTTDLGLLEESSSEEVTAVADAEDTDLAVEEAAEVEEGSEDELETMDLDEVDAVPETQIEAPAAETVDIAGIVPEEAATVEAETLPLDAEPETVGIPPTEETAIAAEEEVLEEAGVAEVGEEVEAEEEEEFEAEPVAEEAAIVAGGWDIVVPSVLGNACLVAAIAMLAVCAVFLFCEMAGISNSMTNQLVTFLKQNFPNL